MKAARCCDTSAPIYRYPRCHSPEGRKLHSYVVSHGKQHWDRDTFYELQVVLY